MATSVGMALIGVQLTSLAMSFIIASGLILISCCLNTFFQSIRNLCGRRNQYDDLDAEVPALPRVVDQDSYVLIGDDAPPRPRAPRNWFLESSEDEFKLPLPPKSDPIPIPPGRSRDQSKERGHFHPRGPSKDRGHFHPRGPSKDRGHFLPRDPSGDREDRLPRDRSKDPESRLKRDRSKDPEGRLQRDRSKDPEGRLQRDYFAYRKRTSIPWDIIYGLEGTDPEGVPSRYPANDSLTIYPEGPDAEGAPSRYPANDSLTIYPEGPDAEGRLSQDPYINRGVRLPQSPNVDEPFEGEWFYDCDSSSSTKH